MAERFTGIVIVRCNCDHAISGAPITVEVTGASGVECTARGVTQRGYFLMSYERGARPVDIQSMQGTVSACGESVNFTSSHIDMKVDWAAVADRINSARKLPRGTSVDDLQSQAEFFGKFTSLDIVMFSCVIEVTVHCHRECNDQTPTDHGAIAPEERVTVPPEIGIALDCPSEGSERLEGAAYGWGIQRVGADAVAEAKASAQRIAEQQVNARVRMYHCRGGCEMETNIRYDDPIASRPFRYQDTYPWECLAVVVWHIELTCRSH